MLSLKTAQLAFFHFTLIFTTNAERPTITPPEPDITISQDSDRALKCQDTEEVTWYFAHQDRLSNPLNLSTEFDDFSGQFVSTLKLNDTLSYQNVGYYYCVHIAAFDGGHPNDSSLVELFEARPEWANRIYVYLDRRLSQPQTHVYDTIIFHFYALL